MRRTTLDLSPVRARYYRAPYQMERLDPLGELHQWKHQRVRRCAIQPAGVPRDLQFFLRWRGGRDELGDLSDWVLHWLSSEWRRLAAALYQESGGTIRWDSSTWVTVEFHELEGRLPEPLSDRGKWELHRERIAQLRINRDEFCKGFLETLQTGKRGLFCLPSEGPGDGKHLASWCQAQARAALGGGLRCASVDLIDFLGASLPEVEGSMIQQWAEGPVSGQTLREFVAGHRGTGLFLWLTAPDPRTSWVSEILGSFFAGTPSERVAIVLLTTPSGDESAEIPDVQTWRLESATLTQEEVIQHLQESWGIPDGPELDRLIRGIETSGLLEQPGTLYEYLQSQCCPWQNY